MRKDTDIKLNGDVAYKPLRETFYRNSDFYVGAVSAFCLVAAYPDQGSLATGVALLGCGVFNFLERTSFQRSLKSMFARKAKLCIDTKPDVDVVQTSPENMLLALEMKRWAQGEVIALSAIEVGLLSCLPHPGLVEIFSGASGDQLLLSVGVFGSTFCVLADRFRRNVQRFKKVVDGTYVIKEIPPPEPVRETAKELEAQGLALVPISRA